MSLGAQGYVMIPLSERARLPERHLPLGRFFLLCFVLLPSASHDFDIARCSQLKAIRILTLNKKTPGQMQKHLARRFLLFEFHAIT